jgi:glycosyltransferase involved in cell wall biosynthesis
LKIFQVKNVKTLKFWNYDVALERISLTHICFVGSDICPPWNEGRKVVSRNIINSLKKYTDLDISVISDSGIDVAKMGGIEYVSTTRLSRYGRGNDLPLYIDMVKRIRSIDEQNKIDILHLFNTNIHVFSFYGKMTGKKVFAHFFGDPHYNIFKRIRTPKIVDEYVTTSIKTDWFNDLGITSFQSVNPPIDTCVFNKKDKTIARKYFNLPEDKFILLYMGNLGEVRFSPDFLREVSFLKEPGNLLLVFANNVDEYWQNNSAIHDSNVMFRKEVLSEEQKALLYSAADAFILPFNKAMLSYKHVFVIDPPITMLEAMSCGVPVIVPDAFSIPNIIEDKYNGYLTPLGDFKMVDDILHQLSEKIDDGIAVNARNTILKDFSCEVTALQMEQIYGDVLYG